MCSGFWNQDSGTVSAGFQGKESRKSEPLQAMSEAQERPLVELLRGHTVQRTYLSMEDVQSFPDVVREVLRRIAGLREKERSNTIHHLISLWTRLIHVLGPLLLVC